MYVCFPPSAALHVQWRGCCVACCCCGARLVRLPSYSGCLPNQAAAVPHVSCCLQALAKLGPGTILGGGAQILGEGEMQVRCVPRCTAVPHDYGTADGPGSRCPLPAARCRCHMLA